MSRARSSIEDAGKPGKSAAKPGAKTTDKAKMAKIGLAVVALLAAAFLLAKQFGLILGEKTPPSLEQTLTPEEQVQWKAEKEKADKLNLTRPLKNKGSS